MHSFDPDKIILFHFGEVSKLVSQIAKISHGFKMIIWLEMCFHSLHHFPLLCDGSNQAYAPNGQQCAKIGLVSVNSGVFLAV